MDEITFDKLPMAVAAIDRKVNGLIERIDTLFGKDCEDKARSMNCSTSKPPPSL